MAEMKEESPSRGWTISFTHTLRCICLPHEQLQVRYQQERASGRARRPCAAVILQNMDEARE